MKLSFFSFLLVPAVMVTATDNSRYELQKEEVLFWDRLLHKGYDYDNNSIHYNPTPKPIPPTPVYYASPKPIAPTPVYIPTPKPIAPTPVYIPTPKPIAPTPVYIPTPKPIAPTPVYYPTPKPIAPTPVYIPTPKPIAPTPVYIPTPKPIAPTPVYIPTPKPIAPTPVYYPTPKPVPPTPVYYPTPKPIAPTPIKYMTPKPIAPAPAPIPPVSPHPKYDCPSSVSTARTPDAPSEYMVDLKKTQGTVDVTFNVGSFGSDKLDIFYEGDLILSTGFVFLRSNYTFAYGSDTSKSTIITVKVTALDSVLTRPTFELDVQCPK